jgi:hypothetical protein
MSSMLLFLCILVADQFYFFCFGFFVFFVMVSFLVAAVAAGASFACAGL